MSLKKLYVANCMKELDSEIEFKPTIKTKPTNSLVSAAGKIFRQAQERYIDKEEEKAYVQYMRFIELILILKARPDFRKLEERNQLLEQENVAITKAENLKKSLQKRYSNLEAAAKENEKNNIRTVVRSERSYGSLSNVPSENIKVQKNILKTLNPFRNQIVANANGCTSF